MTTIFELYQINNILLYYFKKTSRYYEEKNITIVKTKWRRQYCFEIKHKWIYPFHEFNNWLKHTLHVHNTTTTTLTLAYDTLLNENNLKVDKKLHFTKIYISLLVCGLDCHQPVHWSWTSGYTKSRMTFSMPLFCLFFM